jgi:hypothetical protein
MLNPAPAAVRLATFIIISRREILSFIEPLLCVMIPYIKACEKLRAVAMAIPWCTKSRPTQNASNSRILEAGAIVALGPAPWRESVLAGRRWESAKR